MKANVCNFFITDNKYFLVWFNVSQGILASSDVSKVTLKKTGEKDRKIYIGYNNIYLFELPTVESSAINSAKLKNSKLWLLINSPSIDAKFKNSLLARKEAKIKIEPSGKTYVFPDANNNNLFFEIK